VRRHTPLSGPGRPSVLAVLLMIACAGVLATPQCTNAQDAQSMFDDAVAAYQRGRFDSAAVGFQRLVQGGIDDPRVWHNLGNCYYKLGHIGRALVAYQRGIRLDPRDADLQANIRFVRLFAVDKIEPVGEFFLDTWWRALIAAVSVREARWIAALLFWLAAAVTVWRLWPGKSYRRVILPIAVSWCLWLLATGAAATTYARDYATHAGAVVVTQTNVRGGPGSEYALQFVAHDGLLGTVERSQSGWFLVRFPNGLKGWVASDDFEVI